MNKKGQTLVLFVIILPIVILIMAFLVDLGVVLNRKVKLEEISRLALKENTLEEIRKVLENNQIKTSEIIRNNEVIEIKINEDVKSVFGKIIGIKKYHIKVNIKEVKSDEK